MTAQDGNAAIGRVIACPLCGAALPPDSSLLNHKCGAKS